MQVCAAQHDLANYSVHTFLLPGNQHDHIWSLAAKHVLYVLATCNNNLVKAALLGISAASEISMSQQTRAGLSSAPVLSWKWLHYAHFCIAGADAKVKAKYLANQVSHIHAICTVHTYV